MNKFFVSFAIFIVILTSYGLSATPAGTIIEIKGNAVIQSEQSSEWRKLHLKDRVFVGDVIKTEERTRVKIFLVDESIITIGPKTHFKLDTFSFNPSSNQREANVKLLVGKARFNLQRTFSESSRFNVSTPTAIAGVKGTNFLVWVVSDELTRFFVSEGVISIRNPMLVEEIFLASRFFSEVKQGQAPTQPQIPSPEQMQEFFKGISPAGETGGIEFLLNNIHVNSIFRSIIEQRNTKDILRVLPEPPSPPSAQQ